MKTTLAAHRSFAPVAHSSLRFIAGCILLATLALMLARTPLGVSGAAFGAAWAVVVVAVRPAMGLVLIAGAIPLGRLAPLPIPGVNGTDLLVGLTLSAWLLRGLADRRVVFRPPPLIWPLLAFVWVSGLSLTQAASWGEGAPEWLKWIEFAALYLVASQMLDRRTGRAVIAALFLAGLSQVALGFYQFWGQIGPEAFVLMGRFMRAYGTFQQPNPYAGYLGYLAPIAGSLALAAGMRWWAIRRPADLARTGAYAGITATLSAGILMSWSRGAWMGLAAGLAVVVSLRSRRTAAAAFGVLLILLVLTGALGAGWLPESLTARIEGTSGYIVGADPARTEITDANFSVLERVAHWQAGLRMFADHPWLGVGIGNYAAAYPAYASPHWYIPLGHAHNIYINILAETGVLGLMSFGVFWLGIGYLAWRRSRDLEERRALALGILGTWSYLTVHSLFDNLFVQHLQLQLALLLGIIAAEKASGHDNLASKLRA